MPILDSFPEWKVGDPITKITPTGEYPAWCSSAASQKAGTIQGRYWINRAAEAQPGEFELRQMRSMQAGFAPQAKVIVRTRVGKLELRTVSKEIHHVRGNRGMPGFDEPVELLELWPWEHAQIDMQRHLGYVFVKFVE